MPDALDIREKPEADEIYILAGWRQWADAGSISSGLPKYLAEQTGAHPIGEIRNDGFYLFQIPGTHDLLRPVIRYNEGYPESLETPRNEFLYTRLGQRGLVFFIGDEPHLDIDRYIGAILQAARLLGVKRIIGLGGVYGEVPYDKERSVSGVYSLPGLKKELQQLAVSLSDYQGGASIGSVLCKRAGEQGIEYVSFYGFVPLYDFSMRLNAASLNPSGQSAGQTAPVIRIENDFTAWLGITRRINHMLKLELDLTDLEERSRTLVDAIAARIADMDREQPQIGAGDILRRLSEAFNETPFEPPGEADDFWEEKLKDLFDDFEADSKPE